jgi:ATP/ADP translocase
VEGLIGMFRNWTFTLFFCMSELWGDVCLGLLFWGLANDTTTLADAPTLYPLFGLGANVAQALAGSVLKVMFKSTKGGVREELPLGMFCLLRETGNTHCWPCLLAALMSEEHAANGCLSGYLACAASS